MAYEIRVIRYANEHVTKAESLLVDLKSIDRVLFDAVNKAERQYRNAAVHGFDFVPINFMMADNEFKKQQFKHESLQSKIVLNLTLSFTFCSELIKAMIENQENERYRLKVRLIIDRIVNVAKDYSMRQANIAPLASAMAKAECMILMQESEKLDLIKGVLLRIRNEIS